MLVGPVGAGKTSLLEALKGSKKKPAKTQAVIYDVHGVDTPGEYLENPRMYRYIIALAQEVEVVLLLQDGAADVRHYPPGFAASISARIAGVITKSDRPDYNPQKAEKILREAGVLGPIFHTSSETGDGLEALKAFIKQTN